MADQNLIDMTQALRAAGFTGKALVDMVAYGISESGGDSTVINNTARTGDYSVGWFQINYFGPLRASRTAKYGPPEQLAKDPQAQARAAYDLSNHGTNFMPWFGDVINGKLAKNRPQAQQVVNEAMAQPIHSATLTSTNPVDPILKGLSPILNVPGVPSPLSALDTLGKLGSILVDPHFWLRVGEFVAGVALVIFGAMWMMSESKSVGGVVSTAKKVGEVAAL